MCVSSYKVASTGDQFKEFEKVDQEYEDNTILMKKRYDDLHAEENLNHFNNQKLNLAINSQEVEFINNDCQGVQIHNDDTKFTITNNPEYNDYQEDIQPDVLSSVNSYQNSEQLLDNINDDGLHHPVPLNYDDDENAYTLPIDHMYNTDGSTKCPVYVDHYDEKPIFVS